MKIEDIEPGELIVAYLHHDSPGPDLCIVTEPGRAGYFDLMVGPGDRRRLTLQYGFEIKEYVRAAASDELKQMARGEWAATGQERGEK